MKPYIYEQPATLGATESAVPLYAVVVGRHGYSSSWLATSGCAVSCAQSCISPTLDNSLASKLQRQYTSQV